MSKITVIGHPQVLNGSETVMDAVLVDSYGDTKLVKLMADTPIGTGIGADYFIPCAHCGNAVLNESIMEKLDCCYHCGAPDERAFHLISNTPKPIGNIPNRIKEARAEAEDAFWAVIVKHFPEANDGSFLMSDMEDIMLSWVQHWVDNNVPKRDTYRGVEITSVRLHYKDTWHMLHTGGGCMVAITDNVAVAGCHNYLAVSHEHVGIYTDTFEQDSFLMEPISTWAFGDNPTVLMNQIDEFMGGVGYWDTGKLFDDIITIAKSHLL